VWVSRWFYSKLDQTICAEASFSILYKMEGIIQSRGLIDVARYMKMNRLALTRYLAGSPLPNGQGIKITRDGLPALLSPPIRELIRGGSDSAISWSLTMLSLSRAIKGGSAIDLKSITEPRPEHLKIEFQSMIDALTAARGGFLRQMNVKPFDPSWSSYHWSMKSGPTGPALRNALVDFQNLTPELRDDIKVLGGSAMEATMGRLSKVKDWSEIDSVFTDTVKGNSLRKLSVKDDRETKSRIFAILDYFSQTVLHPIHEQLFQILKQFPQDRTFTQDPCGFVPVAGHSYHSVDLSAATDRFPVEVQELLIAALIGPTRAGAWRRILTDLPYTLKGKDYRYAVGQPMGAYSSWASFTLAHHFVIWYAASLVGITNFKNYIVLGDDVVIGHDLVAAKYKSILAVLGVEISDSKTHVSKDTYEFAKRWFHKGVEVTPFPVPALLEIGTQYHLVYELLSQVMKRGFSSRISMSLRNLDYISELLKILGLKGRLLSSTALKFSLLAHTPLKSGRLNPGEVGQLAYAFAQLAGVPIPCRSLETTGTMFSNLALEVYLDMLETDSEKAFKENMIWQTDAELLVKGLFSNGVEHVLVPKPPVDPSRDFPVLAVLLKRAVDTQQLVDSVRWGSIDEELIWDNISNNLPTIPSVEGVNPTRKSHRIMAAQANLVNSLRKRLYEAFTVKLT